MINYYEILEVSEKASDEIIEKAYKVLAKKYHPDLQQNSDKKLAEEKMKTVNEAYEVLSNHEKRNSYDSKLAQQRQKEIYKSQEKVNVNSVPNVNNVYDINNANYKNENKNYNKEDIKRQKEFKNKLEREARNRYLEAYDNYLRSLGYKVKYRWTWEKVKSLLITLMIMTFIGIVLWIIPPSRSYMIKLYEENFIIKMLVNLIGSILKSFVSIFKK